MPGVSYDAFIAQFPVKKSNSRYVAVPASLDFPGECNYEDCQGWHWLFRDLYTPEDVQSGMIKQELLDWIAAH